MEEGAKWRWTWSSLVNTPGRGWYLTQNGSRGVSLKPISLIFPASPPFLKTRVICLLPFLALPFEVAGASGAPGLGGRGGGQPAEDVGGAGKVRAWLGHRGSQAGDWQMMKDKERWELGSLLPEKGVRDRLNSVCSIGLEGKHQCECRLIFLRMQVNTDAGVCVVCLSTHIP